MRSRGSTRRKASKHGSDDSPVGTSAKPVSADQGTEELLRKVSKDEKKGLQAAMRAHCTRRDQCCVLTGECDDAILKCCHVLTPEYGAKWFEEDPDRRDFLCGFPVVSNRYLPSFDTKNGLTMTSSLHDSFHAFRFSIWSKDDKFVVHLFRPVTGLHHGQEVMTPRILPHSPTPTYFRNLFPEPELFRAHFAQAVLNNMRGAAGEGDVPLSDTDTDEEEVFDTDEDLELHPWDSEAELTRKIIRRDELRRSCDTLYEVEG
ncbi:uncharacterized protein EV422DRAFT_599670 [Fimicolochytrium jonesii]|uniref:uncharacterized protein n=1 Tax=Fimicolochytrium jonesii TaxID=1396493 RepID=UPI0022FE5E59|nr:uncharacterized protein EV422DRAFT_599670 [Fimicolochytrium jonesii]KAI8819057.1 hypothetical protein EV422DRAFT_599670 [Fimicolochytrium jonesii]